MRIFYFYDALCGWCYGFSPVVRKLQEVYGSDISFEVISGGMIKGERIGPVSQMSKYILKAYKNVEEYTGVRFGPSYLEAIAQGTMIQDSIPPSRALIALKNIKPKQQVELASAIQDLHFVQGKDLNDYNVYYDVARQFKIDRVEFDEQLNAPENRKQMEEEFSVTEKLGVTGFPCLVLEKYEKLFLLARGYRPYEEVEDVLKQLREQ